MKLALSLSLSLSLSLKNSTFSEHCPYIVFAVVIFKQLINRELETISPNVILVFTYWTDESPFDVYIGELRKKNIYVQEFTSWRYGSSFSRLVYKFSIRLGQLWGCAFKN